MTPFLVRGLIPLNGRKSHTKSRNGCVVCKDRRIKCDETRPSCRNCIRFSVDCHYLRGSPTGPQHPPTISSKPNETSNSPSIRLRSKKAPGRPRKVWDSLLHSLRQPDHGSTAQAESDSTSLNLTHFELLHHYSTSTCDTFSDEPSARLMFRVQIPQMGIEQPFLMHLLLALASRHIQFLTSEENKSTHYADAAEKHFAIALPQVTQALTRLDHGNCRVFYISSLLICWYMFSRGPSPGEYLVFSDHGPPMWLPLLRGVRTIRETEGFEGVFNNTASKSADKFPNADAPTAVRLNLPRVSWQKRFQELGELISATAPTDSVEIYLVAHDRLARNYEATYGDDENRSYNGNAIHQMIFQWLYLMDDEFVDRMQQKKPHALLIVANFALLINLYDLYNCWFLRGWATHILWGIYHSLEDDYRVWMQWPMEAAGIEWSPLSLRSGDHGKGTA